MLKRLIVIASIALIGLGSSAAFARAPKVKEFKFKGDNIDGVVLKPGGGFIGGTVKRDHGSLIDYRFNFNPEMLKLTEEL